MKSRLAHKVCHLSRQLLPPLNHHIAARRIDLHPEASPSKLFSSDERCPRSDEGIQDDHVVIDGKRVRSGRQRLRILPYRLCPEIPDVLDQARGASWSGPELVFGITNYQPIARALSDALSGQGRGFHDIRKWRINQWVRLGWPEKVIESLAGHDVRISKKHYRTPYSASELVRFVLDSQPTKAEVSVPEAL